ncbi:peptidoglycan DD-metalloendopeptidase family protein [Psittacicella gerlachiana]|uniref:LysM domain-containing protein n=1 Tax=Psittacicella gerlachiana TaxID=2028574 RepID=A0A3A1Y3J4_9GAMM|nr:peptidoglycan DD-metalloendopeptidase family protein [Psittacicella gerlachiana]RIY31879.1 hypothetical protein CKF59_07325 [Psittacicella gerlachiana]
MNPKVFKLSLTVLVTGLLAACSAPTSNAPIYNISNSGSYAGSQQTSVPQQTTNTENSSINPTFSVTPADSNENNAGNYNAPVTTVTTNQVNQACEATQPFVIPRGADNKPIYSRIVKGSYKAKNYVVQQSDTFYLLGYLTGTSAEEIARINNMNVNSVLTPGTVVVVNPNACSTQGYTPVQSTSKVETTTAPATVAKEAPSVPAPTTPTTVPTTTTTTTQAQASTTTVPSKANSSNEQPTVQAQGQATGANALLWPANGRVIQGYSNKEGSDHSIHIAGTIGDKIYASQDGHVIFAGVYNQYGNTVLINHNNSMLTVYACNSSLRVKTNQTVKKGDVIALMGNTCASGKTMLFYQVRVNGNTVDPLKYLAKR